MLFKFKSSYVKKNYKCQHPKYVYIFSFLNLIDHVEAVIMNDRPLNNYKLDTGRSTPECLTEMEQVKHVTENKTTLLYQ